MKKMKLAALALAMLAGAVAVAENENVPSYIKLVPGVYKGYLAINGFKPDQPKFHSMGHSHIDAAWKWRLKQTHKKVYNTFSNVIENMEQHPDYTFAGSSPQYYEWILDEHPDLFKKMQEREKEGRWAIVGGMWVEPDGNIPSGESFVRQNLLGQRFYLEHFGHVSEIGWLPDSFGYNRNLPQILARSGRRYAWTKKINTNFDTIFPFHQFHWRGPDGSQLLTTLNPASVGLEFIPWEEFRKFKSTRYLLKPCVQLVADYATPAETIKAAMSNDWLYEMGIFYGEGDGHEGPTETEIRIQEDLVARGWSRFSTPLDFFHDLETYQDRFPVWNDELYLERHRGTLTTQAWIKRAHRKAESDLLTAESLWSLLASLGEDYPARSIKQLWKRLCLMQFHDILPGSSIPEVFEDARGDFAWIESETANLIDSAMTALGKKVKAKPPEGGMRPVLVYNPLSWPRTGLVRVTLGPGEAFTVRGPKGKSVISQMTSDQHELLFRAEDVPASGYIVYFLEPDPLDQAMSSGLKVEDSAAAVTMENDSTLVKLDKRGGEIVSLIDKKSGREFISVKSNRILAFTDRSKQHRAWNIDPDYLKKPIAVPEEARVEIIARGPLFAEVKVSRRLEKDGKVTTFDQRIRLFAGDPQVHLDFDADNALQNALVKLEFNTTIDAKAVAADGAYFVMERPTHPVTAAEKARWEMPCQKWIDLSDGRAGLAILNSGKYGFSLTPDGKGIRQTVYKAAEYPEAYPDAEDVIRYKASELPYTDQGAQHAEFSLLTHAGGWREAEIWRAGEEFNSPLVARVIEQAGGALPASFSFLSVDSDSTIIGAVKQAEDGNFLVVRLVEMKGREDRVTLKFGDGFTIKRMFTADLLELGASEIGAGDAVAMSPYEIKTVVVELAR